MTLTPNHNLLAGHKIDVWSWIYQRIKRHFPPRVRLRLTLSRMKAMDEIPFIYNILQWDERYRVMVDVGSSFGSSFFVFATDSWNEFALCQSGEAV